MSILGRLFQARDKPEEMRQAQDLLGGSRVSFFFGGSTSGKDFGSRRKIMMGIPVKKNISCAGERATA